MGGGFVIAPLEQVKKEFPEFRGVMSAIEERTIRRGNQIWSGFSLGGLTPGDRQFGIANILPKDILGSGTYDWLQTFSAPGSWVDIFSYTVPEDEIHSFVGFAFAKPPLIFSQLRLEIGDTKYPIFEVEEAQLYDKFALILKEDPGKEFVAQEETAVLLRGRQERGTSGTQQRVIPLGLMAYKRKDLVIAE